MHAVDPKVQNARCPTKAREYSKVQNKDPGLGFGLKRAAVVSCCDLILALGEEILQSDSVAEAGALAEESLLLSRANVKGVDMDGDGVIGSLADEYGIEQLIQI